MWSPLKEHKKWLHRVLSLFLGAKLSCWQEGDLKSYCYKPWPEGPPTNKGVTELKAWISPEQAEIKGSFCYQKQKRGRHKTRKQGLYNITNVQGKTSIGTESLKSVQRYKGPNGDAAVKEHFVYSVYSVSISWNVWKPSFILQHPSRPSVCKFSVSSACPGGWTDPARPETVTESPSFA